MALNVVESEFLNKFFKFVEANMSVITTSLTAILSAVTDVEARDKANSLASNQVPDLQAQIATLKAQVATMPTSDELTSLASVAGRIAAIEVPSPTPAPAPAKS